MPIVYSVFFLCFHKLIYSTKGRSSDGNSFLYNFLSMLLCQFPELCHKNCDTAMLVNCFSDLFREVEVKTRMKLTSFSIACEEESDERCNHINTQSMFQH